MWILLFVFGLPVVLLALAMFADAAFIRALESLGVASAWMVTFTALFVLTLVACFIALGLVCNGTIRIY